MGSWIVTRPEPDATALVARLADLGIRGVASPVLDIRATGVRLSDIKLDAASVTGIVFTSRNGVAFGANFLQDRRLPVFAVGPATAAAAADAGYPDIHSAGGDARSLVKLIRQTLGPQGAGTSAGFLLHPGGVHRAADLGAALSADGIRVEHVPVYEAHPTDRLSPEAYSAFRDGLVEGVLLFSPRTAQHVAHILAASGMDASVKPVYAVCLSHNVADPIRHLPWRDVIVTSNPTSAAMLEAVVSLADRSPVDDTGADGLGPRDNEPG